MPHPAHPAGADLSDAHSAGPAPTARSDASVIDGAHPLTGAGLDTITLADLTDIAGLDSRIDRKYIVDAVQLQMLIDGLGERLVALDIDGRTEFGYESSYFDTPELDAYLGSALSHTDRLKVRTRTYLDLASTKIEVKVQDATGITRKFRQDHPFEMRQSLTEDSRWFVESISPRPGHAALLVPVLTTSYRRATLVDRHSVARMTIDAGLRCIDGQGQAAEMPGRFIVEVKSPYGFSHLDQWLWRRGFEPVKISKFATGLAALNAQLPAAKWARVLDNYFRPVADAKGHAR